MEVGAEFSYAGPQASRPTSAKTLPPMAITDRRLRWLNLPEENVSDCVPPFFVETRATVNINKSSINS